MKNKQSQRLQVFASLLLCLMIVQPVDAITPEEQAIPRIVQLSKIPTADSVNEIIALAQEGSTNRMRQQFVMTALIQIGPSTAGDAYVRSVLDDASSPIRSVQGGLAYLAERTEPWMNTYADQFLASTYDGETRCMAAYLAGRLGMAATTNTIKDIINTSSYGDVRSQAAYGLANLLPVAEFTSFIDATDMGNWDKALAKQLNSFLQADAVTKASNIGTFLSRSEFIFPLAAMRYMLESSNTDLLKQYIVRGDDVSISIPNPGYQVFVRMVGYEITGNINNIVISKKPPL